MSKLEHDEIIKKSVQALCDELVKYYPDVLDKDYNKDSMNNWEKNRSIFQQKMEIALYIELARAGYGEQEDI